MTTTTRSAAYVDYQKRSLDFEVGMVVSPTFAHSDIISGRVQAVWPAIGMVDVEWPHGSEKVPVEDLQRLDGDAPVPPSLGDSNIPGGAGTVSVPGGPHPVATRRASARRVALAYLKHALYWAAPDRHYKASGEESESGVFRCPRCKEGELRAASYKRNGGTSERLLACPECLFLIKKCDIIGHPEYLDDESEARESKQPFARIRLTADGRTS